MKTFNRIFLAAVMILTVVLSVPACAQRGPVFDGGQESHGKN